MTFTVEIEREDDGRWVAEVPGLPGAMTYGQSRDEAVARVQALALRVNAGGEQEHEDDSHDERHSTRIARRVDSSLGMSGQPASIGESL